VRRKMKSRIILPLGVLLVCLMAGGCVLKLQAS
jgi:hypothetical protein